LNFEVSEGVVLFYCFEDIVIQQVQVQVQVFIDTQQYIFMYSYGH